MGEPLLFLLVAGAGVAVGLARGGPCGRCASPASGARLGLACLAVQALVVVLPLRAVGLPLGLGALLLAALVVAAGVARANGRLPGCPCSPSACCSTCSWSWPTSACRCRRRPWSGPGSRSSSRPRPPGRQARPGARRHPPGAARRPAGRPALRTVTAYGTVIELAGLFLLLQHLVARPGPVPARDGTAHGAHEARTVPWTTWAE